MQQKLLSEMERFMTGQNMKAEVVLESQSHLSD